MMDSNSTPTPWNPIPTFPLRFRDLDYIGPRFTWCNNRKGDKRVYERIDKALGSKEWLYYFPNTGIKHYPIQISDHAPIEIDLNLVRSESKRPYKVDAWALEHEECLERIRSAWAISDAGSPAYQITRKLSRARTSVKKWTLDKKAEWNVKWEEFDQKLEEGMNIACTGGSDEVYNRANEEVTSYARAVASFWKQRAKVKWMVDGDTCTKYFFNWVKGRAGRNFIHGIKGEDGQWSYDVSKFSCEFQKNFMELYMADRNDLVARNDHVFDQVLHNLTVGLQQDDTDRLAKRFTAKEVRSAVFQMGPL
ncbi:uncharacterized protein LOC141590176 [Silene latifolia]|uniref:uncharacterized protein LOC141590176 n=1 Tax=Silene latifolia TaxID=37657 RepID=UPI003D77E22D